MSSTSQPPPFPSSLPADFPSQSDPQFASFMHQVCLPLGRLHAALQCLQQALGPEPDMLADACMQRVWRVCLQLQARLDKVEADLNGSLRPLSHLLEKLGDEGGDSLSRADIYRILSLTHQQLRRASTDLYMR
jgi:hypothetical protein